MELLRRALLVGCILPGLWLLRLAPLDPLLTVVPVDFAALQKREAASVPDDRKTEAQRRRALLPLPVYVEESLQYNVFSAAGPEWDRFLRGIDDLQQGRQSGLQWRISADPPEAGEARNVFFRADEDPIRDVLDKLAAGGGTTYVSISRPGGDRHYRVDRRRWTRQDFRPGRGFTEKPVPPASLLYPFRVLGLGCALAGVAFFALLPGRRRSGAGSGLSVLEVTALGAGLLFFVVPLVAVGGSVQALSRGGFLALPCWILTAVGMHLFAAPARNAPEPLTAAAPGRFPASALFLREGLAFLAIALGPLAFLIAASMILWNR
jgi:hypothetical protein